MLPKPLKVLSKAGQGWSSGEGVEGLEQTTTRTRVTVEKVDGH
jgi:hypothetical protein